MASGPKVLLTAIRVMLAASRLSAAAAAAMRGRTEARRAGTWLWLMRPQTLLLRTGRRWPPCRRSPRARRQARGPRPPPGPLLAAPEPGPQSPGRGHRDRLPPRHREGRWRHWLALAAAPWRAERPARTGRRAGARPGRRRSPGTASAGRCFPDRPVAPAAGARPASPGPAGRCRGQAAADVSADFDVDKAQLFRHERGLMSGLGGMRALLVRVVAHLMP